ncbi:MAG: ERCC4 domain-containing protein [Candidatus Thorarchaeota archaeon]
MADMVHITVDIHEDNSNIMEEIVKRDIGHVKMRHMETSDVQLSFNKCTVMIEMKRTDFDKSLQDGRLHDQISRCTLMSNFAVLIVEAWSPYVHPDDDADDINEKIRKHQMTIRTLNRKVTVEETDDVIETVDIIQEIARDMERGKLNNLRRPVIIHPGLSGPMKILCGLPNVKEVLAERILEKFGTVRKALDNLDLWTEIHGMGNKKLERIKDVLEEE